MSVHNGERVQVKLPDYVGVAGYNRVRGKPQICYAPNLNIRTKVGDVVTVGDGERTVEAVELSEYLSGFRVVTLNG